MITLEYLPLDRISCIIGHMLTKLCGEAYWPVLKRVKLTALQKPKQPTILIAESDMDQLLADPGITPYLSALGNVSFFGIPVRLDND